MRFKKVRVRAVYKYDGWCGKNQWFIERYREGLFARWELMYEWGGLHGFCGKYYPSFDTVEEVREYLKTKNEETMNTIYKIVYL